MLASSVLVYVERHEEIVGTQQSLLVAGQALASLVGKTGGCRSLMSFLGVNSCLGDCKVYHSVLESFANVVDVSYWLVMFCLFERLALPGQVKQLWLPSPRLSSPCQARGWSGFLC